MEREPTVPAGYPSLAKPMRKPYFYNLFSALYFPQRKLVALGISSIRVTGGFCRLQYLPLI